MHSQVALLLQDAFLQAENFSIPGIGSFVQRSHPDQLGVEIVFDEDPSKAPTLASYWQKEWDISASEAAQRLSELRVAVRWALKTNGHFLIPEVGALHQYEGGKLQFHSLAKPVPAAAATPTAPAKEESALPIIPMEEKKENLFSNRIISYVMIGAFALIGLIILGQGIWGSTESEAAPEEVQALKTSTQEVAQEQQPPQMARAASYEAEAARVDSPIKVGPSGIVSTSRPQDREIAQRQTESSPASMISARGEQPVASSSTMRSGQGADESFVDITVLDTGRNIVSSSNPAARIASRGQEAPAATRPESLAQFHLIAGSFANYQAARDFVEEMKEQGSQAIILPANEQTHMQYRVSIFHHSRREEVARQKQLLLDAGKKAGWIFAPPSQEGSF